MSFHDIWLKSREKSCMARAAARLCWSSWTLRLTSQRYLQLRLNIPGTRDRIVHNIYIYIYIDMSIVHSIGNSNEFHGSMVPWRTSHHWPILRTRAPHVGFRRATSQRHPAPRRLPRCRARRGSFWTVTNGPMKWWIFPWQNVQKMKILIYFGSKCQTVFHCHVRLSEGL